MRLAGLTADSKIPQMHTGPLTFHELFEDLQVIVFGLVRRGVKVILACQSCNR